MGCHFLLQGIFPTQGSNLALSTFFHEPPACRRRVIDLLGLQKQMSQLGTMNLCVLCLYVLRVLILWRTQYRFKHKTDQSHSWTPGCL